MEDRGWIKIHRKSLESSIFDNAEYWRVWCWILMKATHNGYRFPFNGEDIYLEPGSFIAGRSIAIKEMKHLTPQKYRSAISYMIFTQRITIKSTNKFTIIQVRNWDPYQQNNQQNNQPVTNQQPTSNQPVTTYKKDKKDKNVNKTVANGFLKTLPFLDKEPEKISYMKMQILEQLKDNHSAAFYELVAKKVPDERIFTILSEIRVDGAKEPMKLFTYKVLQYVKRNLLVK